MDDKEAFTLFPLLLVIGAGAAALLLLLSPSSENVAGKAYTTVESVPDGFSPPFEVFGRNPFLSVGSSPSSENVQVNVKADLPGMLFYKTFYVYDKRESSKWKAYTFTESPIAESDWIEESATKTLTVLASSLDEESWVLVYACLPDGDSWKCGCRSSADCGHWSIQQFSPEGTKSYSCTGTIPANAALCSGDADGLTADTPRTVVASCTDTAKCEYQCNTGYAPSGNTCVAAASCTSDSGCTTPPNGYDTSCYTPTCSNGQCSYPVKTGSCTKSGVSGTCSAGTCVTSQSCTSTCSASQLGTTRCGPSVTCGPAIAGMTFTCPTVETCTAVSTGCYRWGLSDTCGTSETCSGSPAACQGGSATCSDSDGGKVYATNGTTTLGSTSHADSCSGSTLTEYYCNGDQIASEQHTCANGETCSDGACRTASCPAPSCLDGTTCVTQGSLSGGKLCVNGGLYACDQNPIGVGGSQDEKVCFIHTNRAAYSSFTYDCYLGSSGYQYDNYNTPPSEICDDDVDNDCDNAVDCNDADCRSVPACQQADPDTSQDLCVSPSMWLSPWAGDSDTTENCCGDDSGEKYLNKRSAYAHDVDTWFETQTVPSYKACCATADSCVTYALGTTTSTCFTEGELAPGTKNWLCDNSIWYECKYACSSKGSMRCSVSKEWVSAGKVPGDGSKWMNKRYASDDWSNLNNFDVQTSACCDTGQCIGLGDPACFNPGSTVSGGKWICSSLDDLNYLWFPCTAQKVGSSLNGKTCMSDNTWV